jgi:hypothetical protein
MNARIVILLAVCGLALAGCGKRGTLMPPAAPVFGKASGPPAPVEHKRSEDPKNGPNNPTPTP